MFKSVVDGHLNRRQWLSRCVVAFVYGSSFASLLRRRLVGPLTRSPSRPTVSHHPLHPCSTSSRYSWPHTDCLNYLSTSSSHYSVHARLGPASTGTLYHLVGKSQWLAAFDSCPRDGFRQPWSRCHTPIIGAPMLQQCARQACSAPIGARARYKTQRAWPCVSRPPWDGCAASGRRTSARPRHQGEPALRVRAN